MYLKIFAWKLSEQLWFSSQQSWKQIFLKLEISAEQRCFSADFLWNNADSELNSANFFWTTLNNADLIQNDNFCFLFRNFQKDFNFEAHSSDFQPNLRKEVDNKNSMTESSYWPKILQKLEILDFPTGRRPVLTSEFFGPTVFLYNRYSWKHNILIKIFCLNGEVKKWLRVCSILCKQHIRVWISRFFHVKSLLVTILPKLVRKRKNWFKTTDYLTHRVIFLISIILENIWQNIFK